MAVFLFVLILGSLVLIHEFGHFITAKAAKIRVDEFGFGFPPKLFGFKKGETEYTLNLLPFGGFVKIFGEDPTELPSEGEKKRSFIFKPKWVQMAVIVAGVFFNFIFAWLLFSITFMSGLEVPVSYNAAATNPRLMITYVATNSPASESGLLSGDTILFLESKTRSLQEVTPQSVSEFISSSQGDITVLYKRNDELKTITVSPREGVIPQKKAIGISLDVVGTMRLPFWLALKEGGKTTVELSQATFIGLTEFFGNLFSGRGDFSQISGPVGIASIVGDVSRLGLMHILSFAALLSINLGVINLLPFPALDGGRLLFLLIETVQRKPLKMSFVRAAHGAGFIFLILLMLIVTFYDIVRLF